MSENIIYCYSGTGNCLDIAKNIAKKLGDTDIVMMRTEPEITDARGAKRVGFVFPCYAGGLPGDVEKYVSMVSLDMTTYTFGVVSYAGYPGVGLSKLDEIVKFDYWAGVPHLSTCIWLMPPITMPLMDAEAAQKRSEEKAAAIAEDILSKKRLGKRPSANALNKVESMAWPKIPARMASKFRVTDDCIGCGECARLCPKGNIHMAGGIPIFGTDCYQCLGCVQYCPKQAINLGGATIKRERFHNANVTAAELTQKVIHID